MRRGSPSPGSDDERAALLAGADVGVEHQLQAGRVEERDLAQIEDQDAGLLGLGAPELLLGTGPRGQVQLTAHDDAGGAG